MTRSRAARGAAAAWPSAERLSAGTVEVVPVAADGDGLGDGAAVGAIEGRALETSSRGGGCGVCVALAPSSADGGRPDQAGDDDAPATRPRPAKMEARLAWTPRMSRVPQPGQCLAPRARGRAQAGQAKTVWSISPIASDSDIEATFGFRVRRRATSTVIAAFPRLSARAWAHDAPHSRPRVCVTAIGRAPSSGGHATTGTFSVDAARRQPSGSVSSSRVVGMPSRAPEPGRRQGRGGDRAGARPAPARVRRRDRRRGLR